MMTKCWVSFSVLLLAIICLSCGKTSSPSTTNGTRLNYVHIQNPVVTVYHDHCDIHIPVEGSRKTWVWGVSGPNVLEYAWEITVEASQEKYQLGFTYFNPDNIKRSGTLDELLGVGQTNIWKITVDSGENVAYLEATTDGRSINFAVKEEDWVARLFSGNPKTVTLEAGGALLIPYKREVAVTYVSSSINKIEKVNGSQ